MTRQSWQFTNSPVVFPVLRYECHVNVLWVAVVNLTSG
jgi:hypothetical protein